MIYYIIIIKYDLLFNHEKYDFLDNHEKYDLLC